MSNPSTWGSSQGCPGDALTLGLLTGGRQHTHTAGISFTAPGREGPSAHSGLRSSILKINQPKQYFPLLPYRITLFTEAKLSKTPERNSDHPEIRWLGRKSDSNELCLRSFL